MSTNASRKNEFIDQRQRRAEKRTGQYGSPRQDGRRLKRPHVEYNTEPLNSGMLPLLLN